MAEAIAEEYRSSLSDLNFNSKPHINMLTMLAEENVKFAAVIVKTIIEHVEKVPPNLKLPTLYLVDSIMKNIGGQYIDLFCDHLVTVFSSVFEKVEELTRSQLYKLRQTWNDILPKKVLYGIDCNVNIIDPAWPITAKVPTPVQQPPLQKSSIHVNPKFLGSTATKAAVPHQNPVKPSLLKKNNISNVDASIKEKEFREILKKKEELGRQLKEKKEQVRALELKKLEMAAKQKKNLTSSLTQQNAQVKINNPRDPRLKKTVSSPLANDKSNSSQTVLQSVVVVPSGKAPANETSSNSGSGKLLQKTTSKNEKTVPSNKTFHSEASQQPATNRKAANSLKKPSKGASDNSRTSDKTPKDVSPNVTRDHPNKTDKVPNKKHSLNADEKPAPAPKRVCKPTNKSKQPTKDAVSAVPAPVSETRVDTPILFGSEDKDYRQKPTVNPNVRQWTPPDIPPRTNTRGKHQKIKRSQEPFYPNQVPDKSTSESSENFFPRDGPVPPPSLTRRIPEDNYQTAKPPYNDRVECDQFVHPEQNIKKINEPSSVEIPEQSYLLAPKPVQNLRVSPPPTKHFTLDGINYTLYFVDQHAFVILDNNEPRQVIFRGPPRLVHIEGQHQPILLGFDGRVVEFDTEGKRNTICFGTPSKEVFVNDFPYEAQFGGPAFTVILNDNKPHWIKVEGPVPQVILNVPSNELYDKFQMSRGVVKGVMPDPSLERRDIDMRVKPSSHPLVQTTIMPETKDVDWRQLPSQLPSQPQPSWEAPNNAAGESYNEYEPPHNGRNFQDYQNPPMAPNGPWNEGNGRIMSDRGPPPNRNMDGQWARPGFRPMMQHERPMRPSPPHSWDLPPPPKIPANLVQSMAQMNTSRPPLQWNPLPPPPAFQGQIPDVTPTTLSSLLPPVSSNSNILPVAQPVVPDVGTIYEKLVAAGIIPKASPATEPKVIKAEDVKPLKEEKVEIKKEPESKDIPEPEIILSPKVLRVHYPSVIAAMYKGSQCATCGMRFKEIQSEQYSRHLDWHFRMNRREKDGAKKAYSRRLYYEVKDWAQFKEIEEKEERTPSYFELQAGGDVKTEEQKIQSVPASECDSEKCAVCSDKFQLFWVEEEEEWHLRHAVRHDGEVYHPMCYEDFTRAEEIQQRKEEAKAKAEAEELAKRLEEEAAEKAKAEEEAAEKVKAEEEAAAAAAELKLKEEKDISEIKSESTEGVDVKKELEESTESEMEVCIKVEQPEDAEMSTPVASESESVDEKEPPPPPPPPVENFLNSDVDSDSFEDEFNPPTPDPRFQNLPKVERGKELSALCTIM